MKTKSSLKYSLLSLLFVITLSACSLAGDPGRDKYDGWKGLKFDKTGYFHLAQKDGRSWFVSPEGNAWLSNQMDHVGIYLFRTGYNKKFWANE